MLEFLAVALLIVAAAVSLTRRDYAWAAAFIALACLTYLLVSGEPLPLK